MSYNVAPYFVSSVVIDGIGFDDLVNEYGFLDQSEDNLRIDYGNGATHVFAVKVTRDRMELSRSDTLARYRLVSKKRFSEIPRMTYEQRRKKKSTTRGMIAVITTEIYDYDARYRQYPESLDKLPDSPHYLAFGGKGAKLSLDSWGNKYCYVKPGVHNPGWFDVWSLGPDGIDGTGDDIGNW